MVVLVDGLVSNVIMILWVSTTILRCRFTSGFSASCVKFRTAAPSYRGALLAIRLDSSSVRPKVEISPVDHGTHALTDLQQATNDERLKHILKRKDWTNPTAIQAHAIPLLLKGHDVMASSPTGSGKSLAFGLPLVERILQGQPNQKNTQGSWKNKDNAAAFPLGLIVSPTRELAIQTAQVLKTLCLNQNGVGVALATGGASVSQQRTELLRGDTPASIVVGTPGRILQFLDERTLRFQNLRYLAIDEADRLLDLGFEPQLTRIARLLQHQQTQNQQPHQSILCSATFPAGVQRLAADFLRPDYYFVSVGKVGATQAKIQQQFEYVGGGPNNKKEATVLEAIRKFQKQRHNKKQSSIIVFCNTKDAVERYARALTKAGHICRVLHGDKTQKDRQAALTEFSDGRVNILVATDVAARGLDIHTVGLVIQAEAPRDLDTYTHRVGRTARGEAATGRAVTLLDSPALSLGLVKLLREANQTPPTWMVGMAHMIQARQMDEDHELGVVSSDGPEENNDITTNEQFTGQDFRRTAVRGSYGAEGRKNTDYRSFDEQAYGNLLHDTQQEEEDYNEEEEEESDDSFMEDDIKDDHDEICLQNENEEEGDGDSRSLTTSALFTDDEASENAGLERPKPSPGLVARLREITGTGTVGHKPDEKVLKSLSYRQTGSNKFGQKQGHPHEYYEYLGMFPMDQVYPFLSKINNHGVGNNSQGEELPRILMVAEKPSIAEAIAQALSGPRGPRKTRGISPALPVYEFTTEKFQHLPGQPCLVTVTSVVGHVFSLAFDDDHHHENNENGDNQTPKSSLQERKHSDPRDCFSKPVVKQQESTTSKLRVVDHLTALAGKSHHLVLWLDCDAEGENIAHEVMAITRGSLLKMPQTGQQQQIHRARFSAITGKALQDAFCSLTVPDADLSRSVDARQELDLRVGVALTRLLSWKCVGLARQKFSPATKVISYGPCQTPTLSFCVDRGREIQAFEPQKYFQVVVQARHGPTTLPLQWRVGKDRVLDTRNEQRRRDGDATFFLESATFDKQAAERLVQQASRENATAVVLDVTETQNSIAPPMGLNTVALLQAGSKAMGMSPKQVMNVAEKLYSGGFISYPRTETTKYDPNGFDVRTILRKHSCHEEWGRSASYLLRTKYAKSGRPPSRGKDMGDHPPITPLKAATREEVGGGAAWRVYNFCVRNFLGSLHNDLLFTKRTATLALGDARGGDRSDLLFDLELVSVDSLGFSDCCRWVLSDIQAPARKEDEVILQRGQRLRIVRARLNETYTRPPRFLQEHELIRLMDENRIGTDASMAIHVNNIVDRGYVVLCDETGEPIRQKTTRGGGATRQIGRYLVPTSLGMGLFDLFFQSNQVEWDSAQEEEESPELLVMPSIRRQMEQEVKQIALGKLDKESCVLNNLAWFEKRYQELEKSLTQERLGVFGQTLSPTRQNLNYWAKLGAFEPKTTTGPKKNYLETKKKKFATNTNQQKANKTKGGLSSKTSSHRTHITSKSTRKSQPRTTAKT